MCQKDYLKRIIIDAIGAIALGSLASFLFKILTHVPYVELPNPSKWNEMALYFIYPAIISAYIFIIWFVTKVILLSKKKTIKNSNIPKYLFGIASSLISALGSFFLNVEINFMFIIIIGITYLVLDNLD